MTLNHIHLQVQDLKAAVHWFETIWQVPLRFGNERLATFSFGALTLILDAASDDAPATVGFESDDCDRDFRPIAARGAVVLEPPTDKPWGVRTAYFKGPGRLKFEIEGPVSKR